MIRLVLSVVAACGVILGASSTSSLAAEPTYVQNASGYINCLSLGAKETNACAIPRELSNVASHCAARFGAKRDILFIGEILTADNHNKPADPPCWGGEECKHKSRDGKWCADLKISSVETDPSYSATIIGNCQDYIEIMEGPTTDHFDVLECGLRGVRKFGDRQHNNRMVVAIKAWTRNQRFAWQIPAQETYLGNAKDFSNYNVCPFGREQELREEDFRRLEEMQMKHTYHMKTSPG